MRMWRRRWLGASSGDCRLSWSSACWPRGSDRVPGGQHALSGAVARPDVAGGPWAAARLHVVARGPSGDSPVRARPRRTRDRGAGRRVRPMSAHRRWPSPPCSGSTPRLLTTAARDDSRVAWAMAEELSRRLYENLQQTAVNAFGTVRQRVAAHLLDLASTAAASARRARRPGVPAGARGCRRFGPRGGGSRAAGFPARAVGRHLGGQCPDPRPDRIARPDVEPGRRVTSVTRARYKSHRHAATAGED